MPAERFDFPNAKGEMLAAVLDLPEGAPRAYALFAHCFTCGKNVWRRSGSLTGSPRSASRCCVSTSPASVRARASSQTRRSPPMSMISSAPPITCAARQAPALLIGHSLGGAAVLAAAEAVPEARAVVTIAAPSDPGHVTHLFKDQLAAIGEHGEVEVALAGRPFRIRREFLEDVAQQALTDRIAKLHKALLIFHSPTDDTVGVENAAHIFGAAKHPKSFISLAGADHLLTKRSDAVYVANVLAAWAERYLDAAPAAVASDAEPRTVVVTETGGGKFQQNVVGRPASADRRRAGRGRRSRLRAGALRPAARRARRLHVDDAAALCRAQEVAAGARVGHALAREDLRAGLRGV